MAKWTRVKYLPGTGIGIDGKRVTASKEHIEISKNAAKEGMVLLKNDSNLLPLKKNSRIVLLGKGTIDYVKGGGGSGDVTVSYTRNLYEGIKKLGLNIEIYEPLIDFYKNDIAAQYSKGACPGLTVEPRLSSKLVDEAADFCDTAIVSICRFSGEGWDRTDDKKLKDGELDDYGMSLYKRATAIFEPSDFYLTASEKEVINLAKNRFKNVVIVMNVGGMVDVSWIKNDPAISSAIMAWQGGMEGGLAVAELLFGIGNPSGKLCDTFAADLKDYPSTSNFHDSVDYVEYTEDIYVGYRYFETIKGKSERVVYPFGYGLSYTTFDIRFISAIEDKGRIIFNVSVKNTGSYSGKEVVMLYYSAPDGLLGKPARELGAFLKTDVLNPGEESVEKLIINIDDMASFDDLGKLAPSCEILEKGIYRIYLGGNVSDAKPTDYVYELKEDRVVKQLHDYLKPGKLNRRLLSNGEYESLPLHDIEDYKDNIFEPMDNNALSGLTPTQRFVNTYKCWEGPIKKGAKGFDEVAEGNYSLDEFIDQLSDEDLAYLISGTPNTGVANTYGYGNLCEFGVPNVMTADGPAGLRIEEKCGVCTTAFPCATLIACSFNTAVAYAVGACGGAEVKENNIAVWLTPAVNIHRSPLCGRNFEYYSEDPYLTGKMAASMVKGIQSANVGATVKHFACNNKETNRMDSESRVSQRALREIYLKAFEIIVKEAKPWSIMTSYNLINGYRSSESFELLTGILREEWGFEGMVTTDWWNHGEHYKEVLAGNDIKMGCGYPDRLLEAMEKKAISREDMVKCAKRVLELILKID